MKADYLVHILLAAAISICHNKSGNAQQTHSHRTVLLAAIDKSSPPDYILYLDHVPGILGDYVDLKTILSSDYLSRNHFKNELKLTREERKRLLNEIEADTEWQHDAFPCGARINSDSLWTFLKKVNDFRRKSIQKPMPDHGDMVFLPVKQDLVYVYCFKKPIYFRNESLCLIQYVALCGNHCGHSETCVLMRLDDKWIKWKIITEGVF